MSSPEVKTRKQLVSEWIRRFTTYTDEITRFGRSGVMRAFAEAVGGLASWAFRLYVALVRRYTLMAASGDVLTEVAAERGVEKLGAQRAKVLAVVQPWSSQVAGIRTVGPNDYLEVEDATHFAATATARIRNSTGSVTETFTVISVSVGTGLVNGWDELVCLSLAGAYTPATDDVEVLRRYSVAADTLIDTTVGVQFQTLEAVVTGDANPVLSGEGAALSLADKVWCEAVEAGESGNVERDVLSDFATPLTDVRGVYNPERGTGGSDEEYDFDLKYRTAHYPTVQNQETLTWVETTAALVHTDVLRAIRNPTIIAGGMEVYVLHRNGGTFTTAQLDEIGAAFSDRARSYFTVTALNVTLTSVEVEAQITLEDGYTLEDVWRAVASRLADFIDFRKWEWGEDVDEADLLSIVNNTPGVANLTTSTFLPASDVSVGDESLPTLARLSIEDLTSGDTINADLAQGF